MDSAEKKKLLAEIDRLNQIAKDQEKELKEYRTKGLSAEAAKKLRKDLEKMQVKNAHLQQSIAEKDDLIKQYKNIQPQDVRSLLERVNRLEISERQLTDYIDTLLKENDRLFKKILKYEKNKPAKRGRKCKVPLSLKCKIKEDHYYGASVRALAGQYKLSKSTIHRIIHEKV